MGDWIRYGAAIDLGLELLHAHYDGHAYERHSHESYAIGVTEAGRQCFTCRGAAQASTPGTVIALNPDEAHDGHAGSQDGFTYRMLYVPGAAVLDILEDAQERPAALPFARQTLIADRRLAALVSRLHRACGAGAPRLAREALLAQLILRLAQRHADGQPPLPGIAAHPRGIIRARDYLRAHYADPVTTGELADIAGLSRFHLTRLFGRCFGLPPHAYLLQIRLAEARRRLQAGESAAAVAAAVGFADQAHLTRRFKGAFGVTPARFARAFAA